MTLRLNKIPVEEAQKIAKWKSNPALAKLIMSHYKETTVIEAEGWIKRSSEDIGQRLFGIYASQHDNRETMIGVARIMFIDLQSLTGELGIYIGDSSQQKKGFGKKALNLILDYGFKELKLNKIYLKVNSCNTGAVNLYLKRNFIIEGKLRDHYYDGVKYDDVLTMALFKEDYI